MNEMSNESEIIQEVQKNILYKPYDFNKLLLKIRQLLDEAIRKKPELVINIRYFLRSNRK